MTHTKQRALPDIWLKAAMLGSLWASVEIILGSFLHNLHIPLTGTFLAALGLILMINGYKLWPDKGLFWRTALVTATMKSISPSAIIFGPMVGIFMEGVILELCVRVFRGRWPGFLLGGALAVSWSLFQKIFVMLMTYGPDFVKLYEQLYFMAAKSLQISGAFPLDLVKLIFIIDLSFGALVAALAFRTNGERTKQTISPAGSEQVSVAENLLTASVSQAYSVPLLFVNLLILLGGLSVLDDLSQVLGSSFVAIYVALNIARYSRSLRRLKQPQLWIQLIALMVLSGLLLGGWDNTESLLIGLESGLGMATRALLVIFGFSALSIEIRNPIILDWFIRRGMGIVFEAMSAAFEVLPRTMKLVSQQRQFWRHPFHALTQLLGALEQLRKEHLVTAKVIILSGEQGQGKTSLVKSILGKPNLRQLVFSGLYTEGGWADGERDHYHVVDVITQNSQLLCERSEPTSPIRSGPFNFRIPGIEFGERILNQSISDESTIVIIDEIGHLELHSDGWSAGLQELVEQNRKMIWTIRPILLDKVIAKWPVNYMLLNVLEIDQDDLEHHILKFLA
ncbi:MAG: nucleoside-triphosphatase [Candidatus Marinimicrobia bacterium]|nr:nucleoside-triphosphatase [Candidatus Neomarinimicrobiota bacterium]